MILRNMVEAIIAYHAHGRVHAQPRMKAHVRCEHAPVMLIFLLGIDTHSRFRGVSPYLYTSLWFTKQRC